MQAGIVSVEKPCFFCYG